jgi:hypothetical protein
MQAGCPGSARPAHLPDKEIPVETGTFFSEDSVELADNLVSAACNHFGGCALLGSYFSSIQHRPASVVLRDGAGFFTASL